MSRERPQAPVPHLSQVPVPYLAPVLGGSWRDDWYKVPAGHVDVCNVPLPVRNAKPQEPQ
jgi:hypothetical protein